ncbi:MULTISPECIES: hypothetical protein [Chitinophagaceae]
MKRIFIATVMLLISIIYNQLKAQVADTAAYLKQIVAQKSQYIGKPFSTLARDLKIQIKYFTPYADIHYDISKETGTSMRFIVPNTAEDFSLPRIIISWTPYLIINR